jgi:GDP-D-mannose dehydratase
VPALARRVEAVRRGLADHVPAGNVDVRRDIADVRDVVRAYRLLVERAVAGLLGKPPVVVNVGTGRSVAIREVIERLSMLAQVNPTIRMDPTLVRTDDPPEIVSDSTLLRDLTGWSPDVTLDRTLQDLIAEAAAEPASIP